MSVATRAEQQQQLRELSVGTHLYSMTERPISSQSFTTPAMFIVSADVLPISRNTAMLSAAAAESRGQDSAERHKQRSIRMLAY